MPLLMLSGEVQTLKKDMNESLGQKAGEGLLQGLWDLDFPRAAGILCAGQNPGSPCCSTVWVSSAGHWTNTGVTPNKWDRQHPWGSIAGYLPHSCCLFKASLGHPWQPLSSQCVPEGWDKCRVLSPAG